MWPLLWQQRHLVAKTVTSTGLVGAAAYCNLDEHSPCTRTALQAPSGVGVNGAGVRSRAPGSVQDGSGLSLGPLGTWK